MRSDEHLSAGPEFVEPRQPGDGQKNIEDCYYLLFASLPTLQRLVGTTERGIKMAEAKSFTFVLTATTGLMGAPTFHCNGVLEPGGAIKVEKADITQALPPPHGVTPITSPSGRWGNDIFNNQEDLGIIITGSVASPPDQVLMRVECGFEFPEKGPLKAGETLKGQGSFPNQGRPMEGVPAELRLS